MDLSKVIEVSLLVREQYDLYSRSSYPQSVDDFLDVISTYTGYRIIRNRSTRGGEWSSETIRGYLLRFDEAKEAYIYAAPEKENPDDTTGVSKCERRLIIIKEACHLLIDSEKTYTHDTPALIENLVFGSTERPSDPQLMLEECQSEYLAIIAALELLFPWEDRSGRKDQVAAGVKSHLDVAEEFKIPERHVAWVLSDKIHYALNGIREGVLRRRSIGLASADQPS